MDSLREFFVSSSGLAPVRQGLGLGWVISALTGIAILLSAREAAACNSSWKEFGGYSSGCADDPNNDDGDCKCRTCTSDSNCVKQCTHWYCCPC